MTTINDIYAAINPMPAMLSAKGKVQPKVEFEIEANAGFQIAMSWSKGERNREWDRDYLVFLESDFPAVVAKALAAISEMPDAATSRLHRFMGSLGKLIDDARDCGIPLDYVNPLVKTMKRLSENIITKQPEPAQ